MFLTQWNLRIPNHILMYCTIQTNTSGGLNAKNHYLPGNQWPNREVQMVLYNTLKHIPGNYATTILVIGHYYE